MKMWRVLKEDLVDLLAEVEVESFNGKTVWLNGRQRPRHSATESYYQSEEAAVKAMTKRDAIRQRLVVVGGAA